LYIINYMRAFLEKYNGEWLDNFVYESRQPLIERGYKIVSFDGNDLSTLENQNISKSDICIASVQATSKFFELCNIKTPDYLGYPDELKKYLGRNIELVKFIDLKNDFPYFLKPAYNIKLFTGDVVEKPVHLEYLKNWDNCTDDTYVYKSEVVDFISEYRVFVSLGKIYGMKHYKGDFLKFVDVSVIQNMIDDYKTCPSAYTLDIGLTSNGETLLVEINDFWALGSYGLESRDYALLCARRMREILNN